jgi:hypothetical protein
MNKPASRKKETELTVIEPLTHEPTAKDPLDYWVRWVRAAWHDSVRSIIETGVRIAKLYVEFEDDGQKALVERLGMPQSTVSKLMSIGTCAVLTKYASKDKLPASYTVLYELSQLRPEVLEAKLINGEINPGSQLKDVLKFKKKKKEDGPEEADEAPAKRRTPLNEWDKFSDEVEQLGANIDQLSKSVKQKARASGDYEGEFIRAEGAIETFVDQLNDFIGRLTKLKLDLRGPPVTTAVHVGPKGKRRKAT